MYWRRIKQLFVFLTFMVMGVGLVGAEVAGASSGPELRYGAKKTLAPGVVYYPFETINWAGSSVTGHITEVTPGGELLEIRPALGNDRLGGRETTSSMAARHGAVAAINGGFFDGGTGNPIGGLVVDGKLLYRGDFLRTSLGWTGQGSFQFGYFDFGSGTGEVDEAEEIKAPRGVEHLVTGGPLLVADGIPVFQAVNEGFRGSVLLPNARTAVGVKANGQVLLVVVEKVKDASPGLTLDELAWLMARLGTTRAAALDGGGSSAMWVAGQLVSKPSDGSERKVANALVVLYQIPTFFDDQRVYFDVAPYVEQGRTYVPLRGIFELLGATVHWDAQTQTVQANRGQRSVQLTIGQREALVDGQRVLLDATPRVIQGRTMVPLRFVGESLGAGVEWQSNPKAVKIYSAKGGDNR